MTEPTTPRPHTEVAVGILIRESDGALLITSRPAGKPRAGWWEFPGGKVEPGETPEVALVRELREELGIDAVVGNAIIRVHMQQPEKHLLLDVREVSFVGAPQGLEGQALAWVAPDTLRDYPMPPADLPVVDTLLRGN